MSQKQKDYPLQTKPPLFPDFLMGDQTANQNQTGSIYKCFRSRASRNRPYTRYNIYVVDRAGDKLRPDSPARLKKKLAKLELSRDAIARRLKDLQENREYHAAAIQKVIDEQVETTVAQQMNTGGGGRTVLDSALTLHAVNTELGRLVHRGLVTRYAHGRYGPAQDAAPEDVLPQVDPGAYITGFHALHRHQLVT